MIILFTDVMFIRFNLQIQHSNLLIVSPTLGDSLIAFPTLNDPQIPSPALISPRATTPSVLKVRKETCGRNYGNFKDQCRKQVVCRREQVVCVSKR